MDEEAEVGREAEEDEASYQISMESVPLSLSLFLSFCNAFSRALCFFN